MVRRDRTALVRAEGVRPPPGATPTGRPVEGVNFSRVHWEVDKGGRSGKSADSRSQTWPRSPQGAHTMHHPDHWYVRQDSRTWKE